MDRTSQRLLKEDREHGDVMFPLAAYWIELPAGAPVLDTHWHEEAEFFLLLEGEILFQVDTDYFTLRPGEAVFIESGDIHAAYAALDTPCRFCALVFHPDLLASAQYDTIQQTVILPLQEKRQSFPRHLTSSVPWQGELLLHLERMMEAYDNKMPGFESFMKGTLLIMLSQIAPPGRSVNYSQSAGADTTKIDRLKKVILYIQDNYQEPIRTRDLSELIPMSEGQFCRFFKSMTRKTPVDYINSYRIRQAAALLQQSDRKISDIAMDVGFDNVSYFIKVFRKAMNCSPSEFRKDAIPGAGQGQLYP
ncbi:MULTISPECIES: AraC family transcriptional regulator [unclassified Paenibacillus]|jgi:AraC-like DNA-binding protein/mannose-6-phosphate isomerase-like protein (cupin superfamily)|uniref:AraC family transcriptional regulator n=1 Tax=unclassified Paenibacillus TaxID=185978 RepID=UPI0030F5BC2E